MEGRNCILKIYKIPYSDNYYLTKDCKIYKKNDSDDTIERVKEIACGLY